MEKKERKHLVIMKQRKAFLFMFFVFIFFTALTQANAKDDLSKIVRKLDDAQGKKVKYQGKTHQETYREGIVKKCAFTLDVKKMITTPNCGKTKMVKSFIPGKPDYKMADCTEFKRQNYSPMFDLTVDKLSEEVVRDKKMRTIFSFKVGYKEFFFYNKRQAQKVLDSLKKYQKEVCLR